MFFILILFCCCFVLFCDIQILISFVYAHLYIHTFMLNFIRKSEQELHLKLALLRNRVFKF